MSISKEQYNNAKLVVKEYEAQLQKSAEYSVRRIKAELIDYFKSNLVSGVKIKDFDIRLGKSFTGKQMASIIFYKPYFDEDYWDEKADQYFEELGNKYEIQLGPESGVYPK